VLVDNPRKRSAAQSGELHMTPIVNLDAEYARVTEHWSPRVVAIANGQYLKIARVKGELIWHSHADEDELFMAYTMRQNHRFSREYPAFPA
jgi:hypothetical protein